MSLPPSEPAHSAAPLHPVSTEPGAVPPAAASGYPEHPPLLPHHPRRSVFAAAFALGVGRVRDVRSRHYGMLEWLIPLAVVAIAAAVRFTGLAHPQAVVFDETYYVKDAWSMLHLGYEGSWPDQPDGKFAGGDTNIFLTPGTRVVHPPLGKWIIAMGMALFGAESAFGWRFSTALLGVATVLITYLIARRLTASVWYAGIAGLFLAIDGLSIVLSRVSLLDGILTFFIMLGVLFLVYDHRRTMAQLTLAKDTFTGPVLWNRPWVVAAGVAFGAACAVKWSGLYLLAGFGIYLVVSDMWMRRRAGMKMWGASAIGRQAPVTFLLFVPVAAVVYLVSWTGWLVTTGGYERNSDPNPFVALLNYHISSYEFHVGLSTPHAYASPAWQWPFLIRPTSMYWHSDEATGGVQAITSIPNPLLWWLGCAAAVALVVLFIRFRDWRYALILTGLATTYLPWLAFPERTIFQFYTVAIMPFLMIALALVMQLVGGSGPIEGQPSKRPWRIMIGITVVLAVLISVFFLPIWIGLPVPYEFWRLHMWMPTWI